jgi:Ca2+-binding EF-hand superfamily protein
MALVLDYYSDRYTEDGIRQIFALFDEDGDGKITKDAFKKLGLEIGV